MTAGGFITWKVITVINFLYQWLKKRGLNNMATILQMIFLNAFCWQKRYTLIQIPFALIITISVIDSGNAGAPGWPYVTTWADNCPFNWRIRHHNWWISNYVHYKVWDETTYAFPNFNGCTVEVWECISNFIWRFIMDVITCPCWDWSWPMLVKGGSQVSMNENHMT